MTDAGIWCGVPGPDVAVPDVCLRLAEGQPVTPVWGNELGDLTCRLGTRRYVKWSPSGSPTDLAAEAARMRWAAPFHPVPTVLVQGADATGNWLVTRALPGTMAVAPRWTAEPRSAVRAIGEGLRALHSNLPAGRCPFRWAAEDRVAVAHRRAAAGDADPRQWHADHQGLSVAEALRRLADVPPVDVAVVCHGDTCAPNTLIGDDGRWSGHVDLGALGVADRWADLAIATWSLGWNYGPGWEAELLSVYGVAADPERTAYYRLLWDLS